MKILENIPLTAFETKVIDDHCTYLGKTVQKIEYKEFISFPERFGKGLVAFLATLLTVGIALYFNEMVWRFAQEAMKGYSVKIGMVEKKEASRKIPEAIPPVRDASENAKEEKKEVSPHVVKTQIIIETEQVVVTKVEDPAKKALDEFENQILENLATQMYSKKFRELKEEDQTAIVSKLFFAKEKIVRAWKKHKIPSSERKETIKNS